MMLRNNIWNSSLLHKRRLLRNLRSLAKKQAGQDSNLQQLVRRLCWPSHIDGPTASSRTERAPFSAFGSPEVHNKLPASLPRVSSITLSI